MNEQHRAVVQLALDAFEADDQRGLNRAMRSMRQAFAEPASTLAKPVTDEEIDAAFEELGLIHDSTSVDEMRRALQGFAAGRVAGVEPAPRDHPALHQDYPSESLAGLYEAFHALPLCNLLGVVGAAIQEIQSLRQGGQELVAFIDKHGELVSKSCAEKFYDAEEVASMLAPLYAAPQPAAQPAVVEPTRNARDVLEKRQPGKLPERSFQ